MDIPKVLQSAAKLKATEVRVEIDSPVTLIVRGEPRTLFASTVKARDFEDGVLQRLDAFTREELRSKGRCHSQFEEKGIGKLQVEVEPNKATFVMPTLPQPGVGESNPTKSSVGELKRTGFLDRLFGRK